MEIQENELFTRYLYQCSKCAYKTNTLNSVQAHVSRRRPCDAIRDDTWIKEQSLRAYDRLLEQTITRIEDIKDAGDIDELVIISEDLARKTKRLNQSAKFIPDYDVSVIDELRSSIKQELRKRKAEIINF